MTKPVSYKRHRFPLKRGTVVSYETVRRWALKFGSEYVRRLRRKTPSRRDIWHLDEVVVTISGKRHWLWRAVDQDGHVLDEIVQTRRDTKAANCLLKRLPRKQGRPHRRMITDKLGSYAAAQRQVMPEDEHRLHKGLNNRAENSHLPFRRRERAMQGFRSPRYLQRFVSVFSAVHNLFIPPRAHRSAPATHLHRLNAMTEWKLAANIAA
jgi:putative transposase